MKKISGELKKDLGAIVLASDHGGLELKNAIKTYLEQQEIECHDIGVYSKASVDYPDCANNAINCIFESKSRKAILVCATGQGMSMTANKYPGIRAALCYDNYSAEMSRKHNDSNVLCLGQRALNVLKGYEPDGMPPDIVNKYAKNIVYVWLTTQFEGGRHEERVKKISGAGKKG